MMTLSNNSIAARFIRHVSSCRGPLLSMSKYLKYENQIKNDRECYKADGIYKYLNFEICINEISGPYNNPLRSKFQFDFHKAMYGCMAIIWDIVQSCYYGTIETFEELEVHFLHNKVKSMQSWSLKYNDGMFIMHRKRKVIDVKDGEATFNALLIYPFLEAVATYLKESKNWCKAGFRHGEARLVSMCKQLKTLPLYEEDNHSYLADGIIKLHGLKNIEILLLETSGCFGNTDKAKIAFDHHKGLFGALAMLKSIADEFPMASMETFQKCKVFFTHGAGENIYLWSLRFEPKVPVFELWLEDTLYNIKPDIDDKLETLPRFLKFFWGMKCRLTESILDFAQLKKEHTEHLLKNSFNDVTPSESLLSTIVNPSILKLLEEDDKAGMHLLGPFYCGPSSP